MTVRDNFPPLRERTLMLLVNLGVFYAAFYPATGRLLPTGGLESVWLISAFAMWFLNLLSAPWLLPPRDALANAITAAIVLVTLDLSVVGQFRTELEAIRWIAFFSFPGALCVIPARPRSASRDRTIPVSDHRDSRARRDTLYCACSYQHRRSVSAKFSHGRLAGRLMGPVHDWPAGGAGSLRLEAMEGGYCPRRPLTIGRRRRQG